MITNYKKLTGNQLRKRWEQVSGVKLNENQSHHLEKDKDQVVDTFTLTYGELDKIIDSRIRNYMMDTVKEIEFYDNPDDDVDMELEEIIRELGF